MKTGFGHGLPGLVAGALLAASLSLTPALAEGMTRIQGQPAPNCTCRYRGQDFQLGDRVCLNSPDGPQQAECGFVLNNTSWNFTGLSCAYSSNPSTDGPATGGLAAGPVLNMTPIPVNLVQ